MMSSNEQTENVVSSSPIQKEDSSMNDENILQTAKSKDDPIIFDPQRAKGKKFARHPVRKEPFKQQIKKMIREPEEGKTILQRDQMPSRGVPMRFSMIFFLQISMIIFLLIGVLSAMLHMKNHVLYVFLAHLASQVLLTTMAHFLCKLNHSMTCMILFSLTALVIASIQLLYGIPLAVAFVDIDFTCSSFQLSKSYCRSYMSLNEHEREAVVTLALFAAIMNLICASLAFSRIFYKSPMKSTPKKQATEDLEDGKKPSNVQFASGNQKKCTFRENCTCWRCLQFRRKVTPKQQAVNGPILFSPPHSENLRARISTTSPESPTNQSSRLHVVFRSGNMDSSHSSSNKSSSMGNQEPLSSNASRSDDQFAAVEDETTTESTQTTQSSSSKHQKSLSFLHGFSFLDYVVLC